MAERLRKLHSEIDRTLKRVEEGVNDFDNMVAQVEKALPPAQKEKLEGDLKREIKKLQRVREQLKTWLASTELKSQRGAMEEARKSIERAMERFKLCERLFKTKAFSKEGLAQAPKVDPQEAEKERHRKWIKEYLETLADHIDKHEAELEKATKKGRASETEKCADLERWRASHQWHSRKLEQVLRGMENEEVDISLLDDLREEIKVYLEYYEQPDYIYDDSMYSALGFEDAPVEATPFASLEVPASAPSKSADAIKKVTPPLPEGERGGGEAVVPPETRPGSAKGSSFDEVTETKTKTPIPAPSQESPPPSQASAAVHAPSLPARVSEEPVKSSVESHQLRTGGGNVNPVVSYAAATKGWKAPTAPKAASAKQNPTTPGPARGSLDHQESSTPSIPGSSTEKEASEDRQLNLKVESEANPQQRDRLDLVRDILAAAYHRLPTIKERRHFRYYQSKTPWESAPAAFPRQPLKGAATPQFFSKLDLDTLFFAFYYQQGSYQQYLAARELKKSAWQYHTKYLTWFQPQGDGPRHVTDRGHFGPWVYFDHEIGWCSRAKSDFTFDMALLENELPVNSVENPGSMTPGQPLDRVPRAHQNDNITV